jgi:hypothetical protein
MVCAGDITLYTARDDASARNRAVTGQVHPTSRSPVTEMKSYLVVICLCVALCAASPSTASAQQAPEGTEKYAHPVDEMAYSCVDPADPLARRWLQDEPCKLPMYHLPVAGARSFDDSPRWPIYPPRSPETEGLHAIFWRFPVQPLGLFEAPRHSRR